MKKYIATCRMPIKPFYVDKHNKDRNIEKEYKEVKYLEKSCIGGLWQDDFNKASVYNNKEELEKDIDRNFYGREYCRCNSEGDIVMHKIQDFVIHEIEIKNPLES